jgi:hypothetical protein
MADRPRRPRVTAQDVAQWAQTVPGAKNAGDRSIAGCFRVIAEFLGSDWVDRNCASEGTGFFHLGGKSDLDEKVWALTRVRELAELMLNLQTIEGFEERVLDLRTADETKMESTLAELQIAGLIHRHGLPLRFLPTNHDFDVLRYDGIPVHVEAKCKVEDSEVNVRSVLNVLRKGVGQLPDNEPGALFVKIPQSWHESGRLVPEDLAQVTYRFFGTTTRVISVIYYSTMVRRRDGYVRFWHEWEEVENHKTKFRVATPCLFNDRKYSHDNWVDIMKVIH